ncbi:DUF3068 domain-containing protein [Actinokineospora sp. NPDC004072]
MRRIVGLVLLGLGVFAVAAGLLLQFYAYPRLAKAPHDINTVSVARGSGITALVYVDNGGVGSPEIRRDLALTSTTRVTGDLRAPEVQVDGDVTAWVESAIVVDDASGLVVSGGVRSLCLDRGTGEAVAPCEGQYYEDAPGVRTAGTRGEVQQPGLSFKFPFGTEPRDYRWYDTRIKTAPPIRFVGEAEVSGLAVYQFSQEIPPTAIAQRDVPGYLLGVDEQTVQTELFYEVTRTLWVDPLTGKVIDGRQDIKQELRTPAQGPGEGVYVFNGTLELTDETVAANVAETEANHSSLWVITTLPVILWIAGGVAVIAGLVLLATGRARR